MRGKNPLKSQQSTILLIVNFTTSFEVPFSYQNADVSTEALEIHKWIGTAHWRRLHCAVSHAVVTTDNGMQPCTQRNVVCCAERHNSRPSLITLDRANVRSAH